MNKMKKMSDWLVSWFYAKGLEVECLEVSNWINYNFIFKPAGYIQEKSIKLLRERLSFSISTQLEHIVLFMDADKLYLSFPLLHNDTIEIHFNEIHNKSRQEDITIIENYLKIPVGIGETGQIVYIDLNKKENCAFIGSSQQGKSSALFGTIASLLIRGKNNINFVLIDPLKRKYNIFNGLNNCKIANTVPETKNLLNWICNEIDARYELNIKGRNMPLIVVIDEFQQLVDIDKDFVIKLQTIASTGLEVNVKLLISTQKLTIGTSKNAKNFVNNILSRVYFRIDSKHNGATLYGIDNLQSLPCPGACFINKIRAQFMFLTANNLIKIIDKLKIRQNNKEIIVIEDNQAINYNFIEDNIPNEIIRYIISNCLKTGKVSAGRMAKEFNIRTNTCTDYCNLLEKANILRNLGSTKGRIITELGYKYFKEYLDNNVLDKNNEMSNIIPLIKEDKANDKV